MQANNIQPQMEEEQQSLYMVPLVQKKSTKKVQRGKTLEERLLSLKHQLIQKLYIISPIQFKSLDFRKQLKNYRYEKRQKTKTTTQPLAQQQKYLQQSFFTLKDVFTDFKTDSKRKFYIITAQSKSILYFFQLESQEQIKMSGKNKSQEKIDKTYLVISSREASYTLKLREFQIEFQDLQTNQSQVQRIMIKGRAINAFFSLFTNLILQQNIVLEIVANFLFLNSIQVLPVELYNGLEQRDIFQHIASQKVNILNEKKKQIYGLRIQGLWFQQNIQKLYEKLSNDQRIQKFDMDFQVQKFSSYISTSIGNMLSQTFLTPKKGKQYK